MTTIITGHLSEDLPADFLPDWTDPLLEPYWDAASEGRLVVQACQECDARQWPPRGACAQCGSLKLGWIDVAGRGTIYSWTMVAHAGDRYSASKTPYAVVVVAHETEPVRFVGPLLDNGGPGGPVIGARVVLDFLPIGDHAIPFWQVVATDA